MRWPWQRSEARVPPDAAPRGAAAAPDAAARVPPAGWAFLPPLQRQVTDAAPVVLRPAFVASLPTRTVPTSIGNLGHLVDAEAPSGTIAIDDAALGAPVQRAVATELTLRPGPEPRSAASPRLPLQTTDAAEPASSAEPPRSLATPTGHSDPEPAPGSPLEEGRIDDLESAGGISGGLIGGDPGESVSRLVDDSAPPASDGTSAAGLPVLPSQPARARPILQRLPSTEGAAPGSNDGAIAHLGDSSSTPPTPRRVGLGAPLPSRSVQRVRPENAAGTARADSASAGVDAALVLRAPATPGAGSRDGEGESAETRQGPVEEPLQRDVVESLHSDVDPSPQRDADASRQPYDGSRSVSLLADRLLEPTLPPAGGAEQTSVRPPATSAPRREERAAGDVLAPTPIAAAGLLQNAAPAAAVQRQARAGAASSDSTEHGRGPDVGGGPPSTVQRSVPLVAARRLVPVLTLSAPGSPFVPNAPGRVVVARAVAPSSPAAEVGASSGSWSVSPVGTGSPSPAGSSSVSGGGARHDGRSIPEQLEAGETAIAASVSRPPVAPSATQGDTARPSWATSVLAGAPPSMPARRGTDALPATVQRLAGLPSFGAPSLDLPRLPQAPAGLPSVGELAPELPAGLPSADQLESRAAELAPDATDSVRSGSDAVTASAGAAASGMQSLAGTGGTPENVEQLVRRLYGPLVRRIKAEMLLDRERRGIRIDGI